jgi:hypothetical protein
MKNIQTVLMEEIWKDDTEGHIPVLMEIFNPDIKWSDGSGDQENMYLRVIDDSNTVVYKGKKYLPCKFNYTPPEENGKTIGQASITISALDTRIVEVLRSVQEECQVSVVAAFAKKVTVTQSGQETTTYKFYPLDELQAKMQSATYSRTTAQLNLVYKDVLKLNVPRNIATKDKLPAINQNA